MQRIKNRLSYLRPTTRGLATVIKCLAAALLMYAVFLAIQTNANTNRLIAETKTIELQNQTIGRDNQRHIDCIAQVFARYTRDNQPVSIQDLNTCKSTEQGQTPTFTNTTNPFANTNSTNGAQTPSTTPVDTPKTKSLLHQVVDPVLDAPKNLLKLL